MKMILPGQTIGIIGGGQLGRMMGLAAKESGFRIAVLDPTEDSPCGQIADYKIVADYDDAEALTRLAEVSNVITFEFENIDYEGLNKLSEKAYVPQGAEIIRITQNRINEKAEITAAGAPVATYVSAHSFEELEQQIEKVGFPCIVKTAFGGYDGKGQIKIDAMNQLEEARGLFEHSSCIAEAFVPFVKEVSVIIQRGANGQSYCLPIAENIHKDHILHESIVPARIDEDISEKAIEAAEKIANHLDLIGTLAVEMFVLEDGNILINELAPRPHNSGHYSIEACNVSQFHQHIRAVCGWPLRQPKLWAPSVMVNVLGEHVEPLQKELKNYSDWSVHLYGKAEAKEKRKMGHVTIMTDDLEKTLSEIEQSNVWFNK